MLRISTDRRQISWLQIKCCRGVEQQTSWKLEQIQVLFEGGNGTRDHRRPNHLATRPQLIARAYFSKQMDELTSQSSSLLD